MQCNYAVHTQSVSLHQCMCLGFGKTILMFMSFNRDLLACIFNFDSTLGQRVFTQAFLPGLSPLTFQPFKYY